MTLLDKLEWAYHTLNDKLTFGLPEQIAITRREVRAKSVLKEAVAEVKEINHLLDYIEQNLESPKKIEFAISEYRELNK